MTGIYDAMILWWQWTVHSFAICGMYVLSHDMLTFCVATGVWYAGVHVILLIIGKLRANRIRVCKNIRSEEMRHNMEAAHGKHHYTKMGDEVMRHMFMELFTEQCTLKPEIRDMLMDAMDVPRDADATNYIVVDMDQMVIHVASPEPTLSIEEVMDIFMHKCPDAYPYIAFHH
jgi:hypothetical protein